MRATASFIVTALMVFLVISPSTAESQNYDKLSQAIAKLDSTLKVIVDAQKAKTPGTQQLADAEGMAATPARSINDPSSVYEIAGNLEDVVAQLQNVVTEAKEAEKGRPKYPASTGYGKIVFSGNFQQMYYSKEGTAKSTTFDMKKAEIGIAGSLSKWAKASFVGDFAKSVRLVDAYATLMPSKFWFVDFGQFKPQFGADFLKSGSATPFVNTFKAQSYGTTRDVGCDVGLNYQWKNGNAVKVVGGLFNGAGMNVADANTDKNFVGRVEVKLANMFTVAPNLIAGKTNDPDSTKQNLDVWGGSVNWTWKNEVIEGEYVQNQTGSVDKNGWHVWAAHTFATGLPYVPELQVLGRYEQMDPNMNKAGDRTNRITFGTNLFIDKKYTKLQINYQINGEETKSVDNNEWLVNLQVAF